MVIIEFSIPMAASVCHYENKHSSVTAILLWKPKIKYVFSELLRYSVELSNVLFKQTSSLKDKE